MHLKKCIAKYAYGKILYFESLGRQLHHSQWLMGVGGAKETIFFN